MGSLGAPNELPGHSSQWCVNRPWSDESIDCEGRQARSGCDWSRRFIAAPQWAEAPAAINPSLERAMPPTGKTSALGEGPARDWQIYKSRGSQGAAADLKAPCARSLGRSGNGPKRNPLEPCQPHHPPRYKSLFGATVHRAPPTSLRMAYATTPTHGTSALCELP